MNNQVPDGWQFSTVGNCAQNVPKKYVVEEGKNPRYVGLEHIAPDTKRIRRWRYADDVVSTKSEFKVGDTLFGKLRPYLKKVSIADFDGICSTDILVLRAKSEVDSGFLYRVLSSEKAISYSVESSAGNVMPRTSWKDIAVYQFMLPPLLEQKKIAAILTSVDDVIEKTQAQIDKLKDLKAGMMQELLTRGVGVDGKPHAEFKDSPVGRIPKGWEVEALKEFTSFISYGFTNPMPEAEAGPYMITAKDINNLKVQCSTARRTTKAAYDELLTRKSRPEVNDILLTKDGTLGRVALVTEPNCCINQSVAVITPNERVIPKFLLYLLASPVYQQEMLDKAGGSTIKHIYITVVDKMLIAVPSLKEQEKLTGILDSVFLKLELSEQKLSKLKSVKKALMQDLLTGKVRVKVDS
ncbi:restriction endonuclease subunit S [Vibrio natriegens]|uniref:restriction endonuclease subunit S n=1 Tax=Vibrio natriegens TaxID=691 RepID=UPI0035578FE1